jgi:voltage-gated potassium channel
MLHAPLRDYAKREAGTEAYRMTAAAIQSHGSAFLRRLFFGGQRSLRRSLLVRVALILGLIALVALVFWFDRKGLRDGADGQLSLLDVLYFTLVTVTTVGYGDIVPVSTFARAFDAFVVTPIRLLIWFVFLGTAYELVVQRIVEEYRMKRLYEDLEGHAVICGFGHSGRSAARELVAKDHAADRIVVIDHDQHKLEEAAEYGHIGLRGDVTRDMALSEARVSRAKAVIVCPGRDDTATLCVLSIRRLSPSVRIVCSIQEEENADLARHAGADSIVLPAKLGGVLLADSVSGRYLAECVADLIATSGRVNLVERRANPQEIGKAMREVADGLVLRLYRNHEPIGFWEGERAIIQDGDLLLMVVPTIETEQAGEQPSETGRATTRGRWD